jgi:negative modulator of initiation of replication
MRTIVIEEDLYGYLLSQTQEIGEDASSIIRRLLGLNAASARPIGQLEQTFDFLKRPESYRYSNNAERFLFLLSWAYRRNPEEFAKILAIGGSKRKYFALEPKSLQESGKSVNARPIPDSPFWAITNNSTAKKFEMLSDVFELLGYDPKDTAAMLTMILKPSPY